MKGIIIIECRVKKSIILAVSLALTFQALGAVSWDAGAGDNNWNSANNWTPDTVPASVDDVYLNYSNGITQIYSASAWCNALYGPGYTIGPHTLNMNTGTITTSTSLTFPWIIGGYAQGDANIFNSIVNCGRVYCGFGAGGDGELNIYGGTFTSAESLSIGHYAGSSGSLYLGLNAQLIWDATLYCGSSGQGQVTLNGGTMTSNSTGAGLMIGSDAGGTGQFTIDSGTVNITGQIWLAHSGTGTMTVNNGQVTAEALYIPRTAAGTGTMNLYGGTVEVDDFQMSLEGGTGNLDITAGKLKIKNDRRTRIMGYIKDGWITAYQGDPRARLAVDYNQTNPGYTTVRAFILPQEKACRPDPEDAQKRNTENWDLSLNFSPGSGAQVHHIYLGTDKDAVINADPLAPEYLGQTTETSYPLTFLVEGQWYYWRVDEFDGITTHKGKVWSFKFTENKPTIYHLDLRCTFGLDPQKQYDIRHAAACLQGLVNRQGPKVFLTFHNGDRLWLERLVEDGGLCEDWNIQQIADFRQYIDIFAGSALGLILYDPNPDTGVISTSLAATTAAGPESAIAVRKDTAADSIYSYLATDPDGPGLTVIKDLTGKFPGTGTIWQTSTASTQSSKCDAYVWARENYLQTGLCDPTLLSYTFDLWGLKHNAGLFCQLSNLDYAVMRKGFCFELSPWGDELPNDDPSQPLGTDLSTFRSILDTCNQLTNKNEMIKFCGFVNFPYKYTDHVGGSHTDWQTEWEMVRLISAYNSYMEGDAMPGSYMSNASFYTWFRPELTGKRYIQNPPPSLSQMQSQGLIDTSGNVPQGNYVLISLGDYDQGPWTLYWAAGEKFDDNARGQVACTWACTPNTSDRNIPAYDYMYRNLSDKDCFIAWDSGAGYVHPTQLYGARQPSGYPDAVELWQQHCKKYYTWFDYSISGWLLNGFSGNLNTVDAQNYSSFSPDGIGMHDTSLSTPLLVDNIPVLELTHVPDPLINNIINHSSGVHFAQYRTILMSPNEVKEIEDHFASSGNNHRFLDAQTFFYLLRHHLGGQNTHRTAWISDTIPDKLKAGKTYAVQVTVRNDGWDTWSEAGEYRLTHAIMPQGRKAGPDDFNMFPRAYLPAGVNVETGQSHTFDLLITAPESEGTYGLYIEMVQDMVTWFQDRNNIVYHREVEIFGGADINSDDKVNYLDIKYIADNWLRDNLQQVVIPTGDIVADWPMDDSGTAAVLYDQSGFSNNGSIIAAPYTSGQNGQALSFNGSSSYVHIPDSPSLRTGSADFTISAWINPASASSGEMGIAAKVQSSSEKEYAFSVNDTRLQLDMETGGNNGVAKSVSGLVSPGTWQHVAVRFDSELMVPSFYLNGQPVSLDYSSISAPSTAVNEDLFIGMWGGSYFSKHFHGSIDGVKLFNYLLYPQEIERLAANLQLLPRTETQCSGPLEGDIDGNCIVNIQDLEIMAQHWLFMW